MVPQFLNTLEIDVLSNSSMLARARGRAIAELFDAAGRGEWWAIGLLVLIGGLVIWGIVSRFTGGGSDGDSESE